LAVDPTLVLPEAPPPYPVRLYVMRPGGQSKLLNLPFFSWIFRFVLTFPHYILITMLQILGIVAWWMCTWGILFTGRYPRGLFKLNVGVLRWYMNYYCYMFSLFDEFPPLDLDQRPNRELILEVDYPRTSSRWLNLPFLPLKFLLVIPSALIVYALASAAFVCVLIGQFGILFNGSFPVGLHRFVVGTQRWTARMYGYIFGFTDEYPPFSMA
jgi:hypothetical protein